MVGDQLAPSSRDDCRLMQQVLAQTGPGLCPHKERATPSGTRGCSAQGVPGNHQPLAA